MRSCLSVATTSTRDRRVYHLRFMIGLRNEREQMKRDGLIQAESEYPVSMTLVVAALLLVIAC